ncbi:hypothetical protein QYF36_002530 [Acer negundo]|nr:hypothetical protein QYF36_002530 [Acer negundo]
MVEESITYAVIEMSDFFCILEHIVQRYMLIWWIKLEEMLGRINRSNQAYELVPTTHNVALTSEVLIWNGDYGSPDSFIDEQQETAYVNDSDSTDDDSSFEDYSYEDGKGLG